MGDPGVQLIASERTDPGLLISLPVPFFGLSETVGRTTAYVSASVHASVYLCVLVMSY